MRRSRSHDSLWRRLLFRQEMRCYRCCFLFAAPIWNRPKPESKGMEWMVDGLANVEFSGFLNGAARPEHRTVSPERCHERMARPEMECQDGPGPRMAAPAG